MIFLINKAHSELAIAEINAITGKEGFLENGHYNLNIKHSKKLERLAFTREIDHIDLNKINKFESRRSHMLPAPHPAMTHPRLARAMVNLSKAEKEILDPFCGAGGILIEAGLCGLHVTGFDIDEIMLKRAKINLEKFNIKTKLKLQDATDFKGNFEAVVTDLPYGKNTKVNCELEKLYSNFLINLRQNKIKKLVVGFPDVVDYRKLINEAGFEIKQEFSYYLHRSLSKKIIELI